MAGDNIRIRLIRMAYGQAPTWRLSTGDEMIYGWELISECDSKVQIKELADETVEQIYNAYVLTQNILLSI